MDPLENYDGNDSYWYGSINGSDEYPLAGIIYSFKITLSSKLNFRPTRYRRHDSTKHHNYFANPIR